MELRTEIEIVILLLVMILSLLTVSQEKRPHALRQMLLYAVLILVAFRGGPFIFDLLFTLAAKATQMIRGNRESLPIIGGIVLIMLFGGIFGSLWWQDVKENRAIRAGSQEAFDRRVEEYIKTLGYDREQAVAAAMRIREDSQRRKYRLRVRFK